MVTVAELRIGVLVADDSSLRAQPMRTLSEVERLAALAVDDAVAREFAEVFVPLAPSAPVGDLLVDEAAAHTKFSNDRWVFRGRTIKGTDRSHKKDPVNVIFMGHPQTFSYQTDTVRRHIRAHSGWGKVSGGKQRMVWTLRNSTGTKSDTQELQVGSAVGLVSRWHARLWDDVEHNGWASGHTGVKRWMVGGVHRDKYDFPLGHSIGEPWDVARRKLINEMASSSRAIRTRRGRVVVHASGKRHCAWPTWRKHAGARNGGRRMQGYRNSGRIGRVSLKHTAAPGSC